MHAYERHFGFCEPPFSVTPDPRFFYANPAYREAYSTLRYGVEARKGFILVTGEAGTGKTTLLRMLMQHADSAIQTAFIFNPPGTFTELLHAILSELECTEIAPDKAGMTAQFNDYLLEQFKQGNIVSVLIDEAQSLSYEMLEQVRLLSNLEARNAKLVQIVLMGQPELEQKLDRWELRQLKQRMALRCRIQPLPPEDVAQYIDFRLSVAGYKGAELFSRGGIDKIALYSQGIPRLINVLCDNALLRAYRRGASKVSRETVNEAAHDLRLDRLASLEPASVYAARELSSRSSGTISDPVETRSPAQRLRARVDWPTLKFGFWFAVITLTAAVAVQSFEHSGLGVAPMGGDLALPLMTSRNDGAREEAPVVPRSHASRQGREGARTEVLAAQRREAIAGDGVHESEEQETPGGRRKLGTAAGASRMRSRPEQFQEDAGEGIQSRVIVRLDRNKTVGVSGRSAERRTLRIFNVIGPSLVREKPAADAEITGSFEPGMRVRVTGKAGEYLRVQSLDRPELGGYVHVEDAFFEPAG